MSSMNRVTLMGHLTRDPVLKNIGPSSDVADLGLAINENYKSRDGNIESRPVFVDVVCWNGTARACAEHLVKGAPVLIEGKLQLEEWSDRATGEKRTKLKVRAERIHFLAMSGRRSMGEGEEGVPPPPPSARPHPAAREDRRSAARRPESAMAGR